MSVRDFLRARRDRALGSILGYIEREIFPSLDQPARTALRKVVLDALNGYHDSVLDLVKSEDESAVRNEEVIMALDRFERMLSR